jgi:hypothetical protein
VSVDGVNVPEPVTHRRSAGRARRALVFVLPVAVVVGFLTIKALGPETAHVTYIPEDGVGLCSETQQVEVGGRTWFASPRGDGFPGNGTYTGELVEGGSRDARFIMDIRTVKLSSRPPCV